jgi:hypothetical protein
VRALPTMGEPFLGTFMLPVAELGGQFSGATG